MSSFLVGLGIGFGLGVLFAPMSGRELRDAVSDRANEFADKARESYERGRQGATAAISAIGRERGEMTGTGGS